MVDEDVQRDSSGEQAETKLRPPAASSPAAPVHRWLAEHGDVLWRFALARTRSRDSAEEVVQETVLAAMQGYATVAGGSSERTWLLGIAAHKVADHFRSLRRQARRRGGRPPGEILNEGGEPSSMFTQGGMWAKPPGAWGLDPNKAGEEQEMLRALRRCIELLPPSLAEAVWLRDLLDIPTDTVCKATGLSPTNVWSRSHRARAALRTCVEKSIGIEREGAE